MNKFWVIALDVYKKNIKSISFLIMILVPFIAMGGFYLISYFADGMSKVAMIMNLKLLTAKNKDNNNWQTKMLMPC